MRIVIAEDTVLLREGLAGLLEDAGHEVVATLVSPGPHEDTLGELTPREQEVLALMAEGRTNAAIAKRLWLTERTVETHVRSILGKLGLPISGDDHRRVLAVLTFLRASSA